MEKKINRKKNFSVDHSGQILTDSRKLAKILPISRKSHHPIETLLYIQYRPCKLNNAEVDLKKQLIQAFLEVF